MLDVPVGWRTHTQRTPASFLHALYMTSVKIPLRAPLNNTHRSVTSMKYYSSRVMYLSFTLPYPLYILRTMCILGPCARRKISTSINGLLLSIVLACVCCARVFSRRYLR